MPTLLHEFRHIEYIEKEETGIYSGKERGEQSSEGHVLNNVHKVLPCTGSTGGQHTTLPHLYWPAHQPICLLLSGKH